MRVRIVGTFGRSLGSFRPNGISNQRVRECTAAWPNTCPYLIALAPMSRFFETLKEVSRSEITPNGTPPPPDVPAANGANAAALDLEKGAWQAQPAMAPGVTETAGHLPADATRPFAEMLDAIAPVAPAPPVSPVPEPVDMYSRVLPVKIEPSAPLMPHTTDSSIVEQYRRLRTKIQQQHEIKPIQSLLIASPGPGEGKSVTAMNLAMSFAMLPGYRVLLIDGDLRKGTVGQWLNVSDMPGLSNLVDGSATPQDVVFSCRELPMYFMTSGTSQRPAGELLTSSVLRDSIREMTRHFDLVLVDSPPVNLIADAQMLANSCDGVLLVARAFTTTTKAFQKTLDDIQAFRLVGTVLNGGMRTQRYKYHNY